MIFPAEGVVGFGVFGHVTSSAPRPNAGRLWINYVTSKRGSTAMTASGAYGTHPDAPPPAAARYTFPSSDKVWTIAPQQWDAVSEKWTEEWKKIVAIKR